MQTLFNSNFKTPLPEKFRPKDLKSFIGQRHLLDEGKIIRSIINNNNPLSLILWGPPGSGKTTLAHIIADSLNMKSFFLSAVSAGVADVKKIISIGKENRIMGEKTLLFLDEIHRFNKAQQDSVLGAVENGDIVLIGATTENPSFSIIAPLLSRTRVVKLNPFDEKDLDKIFDNALNEDEILSSVLISEEIKQIIIQNSGGDARRMFNILESSLNCSDMKELKEENVKDAVKSLPAYFDKKGDRHFDTISAFIKSMRGSDPDGAVYYLAMMLNGGEDPVFIARRMLIFASEDVGNASPTALTMANTTLQAVQSIGMPEARIILAQCTTFLASAPKSNSSYLAIDKAMVAVKTNSNEIPLHIRNAPTKLMKKMGYNKGYKYPHDYPEHFVKEKYLPENLKNEVFYIPSSEGSEKYILERLKSLWNGFKNYNSK